MKNYRNIVKQLESLGVFKDAPSIAFSLLEKDNNLELLSDEHIKTLLWLNTIFQSCDNEASNLLISEATLIGSDNIKNVINQISNLLQIDVEKIYFEIKSKPEIILSSSVHVENTYNYLKNLILSNEQIKTIYFDALLLDDASLHERCELVLKYWELDDLIYLVKNGLLSNLPYYDVVEAITMIVSELGTDNAIKFLHSYSPFLIEYRSKHYRKLPSDVFLYQSALKALDEYKKSNI